MECTNLVDPHQLLCPWFTVVFVLFCIYTPTICSQDWLSTKSEVYFGFSRTLKYYVIKSETCNRSFIFSGYSDDLHQWKWQPRYNWNIIEKCVKHHNPNPSGAYILIRSICHNWTIFDKPREKNWTGHQDTLESERIQIRPRPWLTIGLGNRLSGVYMQNSTNTTVTVNQGQNSWWGSTQSVHSIRLFFRNQGNRQ